MVLRLRRLALGWLAWAAVSHAGRDVLRIGGRLLLARLLWPEDFGRFTLALVAVVAVEAACQLQLHQPIVQRPTLPSDLLATAYWTQAALGAAGTVLLMVLAGPLGALTGQPAVAPLIRGLSPLVLLGGLSAVLRAWLWREAAFRRLAGRELLSEAAGFAAGLAAATAGAGAWSLVVLELVRAGTELLFLRLTVPWRPAWRWSRRHLSELFAFGWPLLGRKAVDVLFSQADRFLVGRLFGAEALGLYALALRGMEALADGVGLVFQRVAFPIFARTLEDRERSLRGLIEAARVQALLTVPLVLGTALLAGDLVALFLGDAWTGATPLVQVLAVRALLGSLLTLPQAALLGRGEPRLLLGVGVARLALFTVGWGIGLAWGPIGVAAGGGLAAAATVPLAVRALARSLPVSLGTWARAILPAAAGGAVMGLVVAAVSRHPELLPGDRLLRIGVLAGAAGLSYVLPLAPWLAREWRRQRVLLGTARPSTRPPSPTTDGDGA